MTELTAKKGMVKTKVGHGKDDFDFKWLKDVYYNDKLPLDEFLTMLFKDVDEHMKEEFAKRDNKIKTLEDEVSKLRKTLEETLKGLITR